MIFRNGCRRVRNILRGLVQSYGTADIKKRLWDKEYTNGQWDCLDNMAEDCIYPYIERYVRQGSILDLGCGPGATGNELNADMYSTYTGIDISEVAIARARERTRWNNRSIKNEYLCSDIGDYTPAHRYDVIVFGDSIYYVSRGQIGKMLHRYSTYLDKRGVFIVRIRGAYPSILAIIEDEFLVIEKQFHFNAEICVVVFRPMLEHQMR